MEFYIYVKNFLNHLFIYNSKNKNDWLKQSKDYFPLFSNYIIKHERKKNPLCFYILL